MPKKHDDFRDKVGKLDVSQIAKLHEFMDDMDPDLNCQIEDILNWAYSNDDVLDDAISFLEQKDSESV